MPKSTFLKDFTPNFETLLRAAQDGNLALTHCRMKSTGKDVAVLTAINSPDANDEMGFVPFAVMIEGDPYELLFSPLEVEAQDEEAELAAKK